MPKILINVPSITYAIKSEKLLSKNKIKCTIIKTPSNYSPRGCSYSLVADKNNLDNISSILESNNIKILAVFDFEG